MKINEATNGRAKSLSPSSISSRNSTNGGEKSTRPSSIPSRNSTNEDAFDKSDEMIECAVCCNRVICPMDLCSHVIEHNEIYRHMYDAVLAPKYQPLFVCNIVEDPDDAEFLCAYCNIKMNKKEFIWHLRLHMLKSGLMSSSKSIDTNNLTICKLHFFGLIKDYKLFFLGSNKSGRVVVFCGNFNGRCIFWELRNQNELHMPKHMARRPNKGKPKNVKKRKPRQNASAQDFGVCDIFKYSNEVVECNRTTDEEVTKKKAEARADAKSKEIDNGGDGCKKCGSYKPKKKGKKKNRK